MQTKYDLVIYGATGFTGCLAAQYMMRPGIGDNMNIAIAGRNKQKLENLQKSCSIKPTIIIADSSQPDSVDQMAQNAKVVLSFAGPFTLYGEPVVAACAKWGRDYLDITGETPFIRNMIDRYQQQAIESGARLIPFSGFDSIPADLTTYLALAVARRKNLQLDELCLYYKIKGGFNGGTLATALNTAEHIATHKLFDPNILIPDSSWPRGPRATLRPRFEPVLGRWTAPFFMSSINQAVVRRSTWLRSHFDDSIDHDFKYEERMIMSRRFGRIKAGLTNGLLATFGLLLSNPIGRKILRRIGPKPGEGPSEKVRREGFFRGKLVCRNQGQCKLIVSMEREGDPGNEITVALACESARLAVENAFIAGRKGFLTPSIAFDDHLVKRLEKAGFRFKTEFA